MKLSAICNHILFEFLDSINSASQFVEKTAGGLILAADFDESSKRPRWARVVSVGPKADDILRQEGCEILIENLRWTEGVYFEGKKIWRTDDTQVLAYRFPGDSV
jgi:co-chaperonin GroES (HSP10)